MCWCVGKLLLLASMLKRLFKRSQSGASGAETHLLDLLLQAGLSLCLPIHHDPSEVYTACRGPGCCCGTIRIPPPGTPLVTSTASCTTRAVPISPPRT